MKSLLVGLLLSILAPMSAFAIPQFPVGEELLPGINLADGQIFIRHDRRFVKTRRVCNLSHVLIYVSGDNVTINDFDLLFGNDTTQDLKIREYRRKGSATAWKNLNGGLRCIDGFSFKATSDLDWDNARIHLVGLQRKGWDTRQIELGSALVKDL